MVATSPSWSRGASVAGRAGRAVRDRALALYRYAAAVAARGRDPPRRHEVRVRARPATGELILIDEVLTPDSSRFWDAATYEPGRAAGELRQAVRARLARDASRGTRRAPGPGCRTTSSRGTRARYVEAFERITGASFERYLAEDVIAR